MSRPARCRKCAMRLEDIQGRRTVIRRLLGSLQRHPESAKAKAWKDEIVQNRDKVREEMFYIDTCECTVPAKV